MRQGRVDAGRAVLCLAAVLAAACGHDWSAGGDGEDDTASEAEGGGEVDADADADADTPDGDAPEPDEGLDAAEGDADGLPDELPAEDADAEDATADDAPIDIPPTCGDGVVDPGEECDDGNCVDGDGCDSDQTYSCHLNSDCPDDGNVCTTESCTAAETGRLCIVELNTLPCDDGNPCSSGDRCDGSVCIPTASLAPWYQDADGDGYGDPGVWTCRPGTGDPWVTNNGDCCDLLFDVNPGQSAFFNTAYDCAGLASWDYDCDGLAEPQSPSCVTCTVAPDGACTTTPGWLPGPGGECGVPACGEGGSFVTLCVRGAGSCVPGLVADMFQPCN